MDGVYVFLFHSIEFTGCVHFGTTSKAAYTKFHRKHMRSTTFHCGKHLNSIFFYVLYVVLIFEALQRTIFFIHIFFVLFIHFFCQVHFLPWKKMTCLETVFLFLCQFIWIFFFCSGFRRRLSVFFFCFAMFAKIMQNLRFHMIK